MVTAISVSISGGNQSASGTKPKADGDERDRMRDRERGDDDDERPQPPERDHQAAAGTAGGRCLRGCARSRDTTKRSAAWCQRGSRRTRPGSPWNSKARAAPPGGRKRSAVETFWPSRSTRGWIGEFGAVGADRIFEQHVEQLLVPVELEIVRRAAGRRRARAPARRT